MPIPYCVNATEIPIGAGDRLVLTADEFAGRVRQAFQRWEDLPDSDISFRYTGLCANVPWDISDYVNTVGWGQLWSSAAGLAHPGFTDGTSIRRGDFAEMYEVDIVIDTRLAQSFDDVDYYENTVLPHILLHEVGHFIGLDHSSEPCAVMSPSGLRPGFCRDDVAGAAALYPARQATSAGRLNPPTSSCGAATTVTFSWRPAAGAREQWLDLSYYDNGFVDGTYAAWGPIASTTASLSWPGLERGARYYWRVNALTANGWVSLRTASFVACG